MRRGNVDLPVAMQVAPLAIAAGFGGAILADKLDEETLRRVFGVVVVYFSLNMIIGALRRSDQAEEELADHGRPGTSA